MKASDYWLQTQRHLSKDIVSFSHKMMIQSGFIRSIGSGLYAWLPSGMRILHRLTKLIRCEMNAIGGLELLMPIAHPIHLWKKTGRDKKYGPELFVVQDRHHKPLILGPTHEECIAALVHNALNHEADFPKIFYQMQTKFRDERRPRGGVIRAREFLMKDAYSFHLNTACLKKVYNSFYEAYQRIFDKLFLKVVTIAADNGQMGGNSSHEFHALCDSGEEILAINSSGNAFCADTYQCHESCSQSEAVDYTLHVFATKNDLMPFLGVATAINHIPSLAKVNLAYPQLNLECIQSVEKKEQLSLFNADFSKTSSWSQINFPCLIDYGAQKVSPLFKHQQDRIGDFRRATCGDWSTDPHDKIVDVTHGLEIGHIFQLGDVYSKSFDLRSPISKSDFILMGCYGIGLSRLVAAIIEQHSDERGPRFPACIAPFTIGIAVLNAHLSVPMHQAAQSIFKQIQDRGCSVFFDDRELRPGVMLTDLERLGIPYVFIFGAQVFEQGNVECKIRLPNKICSIQMPYSRVLEWLYDQDPTLFSL